ncbi:hypothetical protein FACS189476_00260 [Spirochaetia bacterium]|nr:hypothetical protein FACS189476_00260 [Spirochaetia bacterium]
MAAIVIACKSKRVAGIVEKYIRRDSPLENIVIAPDWEVLKRCIKGGTSASGLGRGCREDRPRLIFMESNFFHMATAYMISLLIAEHARLRIAVFSFELLTAWEQGVFYSLGAKGFVNLREDETEWGKCVKALLAGDEDHCPALLKGMEAARMTVVKNPAMTAREMQIVRLVCVGKSNEEIGAILCLKPRSIKNFKTHIYEKYGVKNNVQLVHLAVYMNWIELQEIPKMRLRIETEDNKGVKNDTAD